MVLNYETDEGKILSAINIALGGDWWEDLSEEAQERIHDALYQVMNTVKKEASDVKIGGHSYLHTPKDCKECPVKVCRIDDTYGSVICHATLFRHLCNIKDDKYSPVRLDKDIPKGGPEGYQAGE